MLEDLGKFTGHFCSDTLALEPFICEAIHNYMHPAPAAPAQATPGSQAGYQWKQVFLPHGTLLRASFGGQHYFAQVDGNEIRGGEQSMSPSQFANLRGSGNRNAWKAVWLRPPGSDEWLLADVFRSARKMAIARLLGGTPAQRSPQERRKQPADRRTASRQTPSQRNGGQRPHQRAVQQSGPCQGPSCSSAAPQVQTTVPGSGSQKRGRGKGRRGKRHAAKQRP